jgi:hypothetical protein
MCRVYLLRALVNTLRTIWFHKRQEMSLYLDVLLASQKLCYMELVRYPTKTQRAINVLRRQVVACVRRQTEEIYVN